MDPHQANLQPNLLLLGSCLRFNPTPTFLGVTFDCTLSFSMHVSLLKAKFFPRLKALCCISASSWGPLRSPSLFCINLFFGPFSHMLHPDGFLSWNRAVCIKHQIMRDEKVKVGESRTLARKREIRARAWRGKGGLHRERRQIPRRKGRASKKSLPRTSRRKHKRVSGRKSSPGQSAESWFHSKSGQTRDGKGGWQTKSPLIR